MDSWYLEEKAEEQTAMQKRVVVSGYVFANIIHEASKSENDTEGLLCGNIIQITKDQITDSDASRNHEELEYALFDVIPYKGTFSFYDHLGKIVINHKNKSDSKLLLGWYKIRRNTSSRISMREKTVIKNFIEKYSLTKGLVFILCTPQFHSNRSTINFTYKCFFCCKEEKCPDGLKINIINLGHTGTHPEYRNRSCLIEPVMQSGSEAGSSVTSATTIPLICDSFENTFLKDDGTVYEVHHIRKMYKETMTIMQRFQENLSETEKDISRYEREIKKLRKLLEEKEVKEEHTDDECKADEELCARSKVSELSLEETTLIDSDDSSEQF